MRIEDVPRPATPEDAELLLLDELLLGYNVRDMEGRRVEPRAHLAQMRTAPVLGLPFDVRPSIGPLGYIGAAANSGAW